MRTKRGPGLRRGFSLLDAAAGIFVLVWVILIFAASYPTSYRAARMNTSYSQAVAACQHKIDQMRSLGYGRLTSTELRSAGVIDVPVSGQPLHFEVTDGLATDLWSPSGTITISSAGTNLRLVVVHLDWQKSANGQRSSHEVRTIIANE